MTKNYVFDDETFDTAPHVLGVPGTLTIEEGAHFDVKNNLAFDLLSGPWTVKMNGSVETNKGGFFIEGSGLAKNSKFTVGAEGSIDAGSTAILVNHATDLVNSGIIRGDSFGFLAQNLDPTTLQKGFTVTNNKGAEIVGEGVSGVYNSFDAWAMTVKNAGTIEGQGAAIQWEKGAAFVTNSGTVNGNIEGDSAGILSSLITNSGTITGNVLMANGDDTVKNTGTLNGSVSFYAGEDSMTNSGDITGSISFIFGADTLTNSGSIGGAVVFFNSDDNHVSNKGTLADILSLGAGNDVVTNVGQMAKAVTLGDGNNTFTNSGTLDATLDGGAQDDPSRTAGRSPAR
jgi:hypothetical protein